jgi:hypothetical protein
MSVSSNDSFFYVQDAAAGQIYPVNNEDVALRKEILTIRPTLDKVFISVYFEFEAFSDVNDALIGFDSQKINFMNQSNVNIRKESDIHDFIVKVNNVFHDFSIEARNVYSANGDLEKNSVFLFHADFKKGKNIIEHSYSFRPVQCFSIPYPHWKKVGPPYSYSVPYVLLTGKYWANRRIDSFEIYIITDDNLFLNILEGDDYFFDFEIRGIGKKDIDFYKGEYYLKSGFFYKKIENFTPTKNLQFSITPVSEYDYQSALNINLSKYQNYFINILLEKNKNKQQRNIKNLKLKIKKMSAEDFSIFLTLMKVFNNVKISDTKLKDVFNNYFAYCPIYNQINIDQLSEYHFKLYNEFLENIKTR